MQAKSICLIEHIAKSELSREMWRAAGTCWTVQALLDLYTRHETFRQLCSGRTVALGAMKPIELAALLVLLDGTAKAFVFIPPEQPAEQVAKYLEHTGATVVLTRSLDRSWPATAEVYDPPGNVEASSSGESASIPVSCTTRTAWIIPTSGTTKKPKLISHTLGSMTRSVRIDARYQQYRWGLLYDLTRFAGLQVFLQCILNRSVLLFPPADASMEAGISMLAKRRCNALSATPTLWRKILMVPASDALSLEQITLGGEIADAAVLGALANKFPSARITHIYASTEAGVGFAVSDGREGFPAYYLDEAPGGIQVAVDDNDFLLLKLDQPEQTLIGIKGELFQNGGWINTGDLVEQKEDRFLFRGRANGAINVGGSKVYPEEVERVIREVRGVQQAVVRARRSSVMGNLVEAVVVPGAYVDDEASLKKAVRQHCIQHLPRHKVPAIVAIEESIIVGATGKVTR